LTTFGLGHHPKRERESLHDVFCPRHSVNGDCGVKPWVFQSFSVGKMARSVLFVSLISIWWPNQNRSFEYLKTERNREPTYIMDGDEQTYSSGDWRVWERERELASVQDVRLWAKVGVWFLVAYFKSHHIPRFFFKKRGILISGLLHLINIIQVGMLSPQWPFKNKKLIISYVWILIRSIKYRLMTKQTPLL